MDLETCDFDGCDEKAFMRCKEHNRCDDCKIKRKDCEEKDIHLIHRCEGLWCDNCWKEKMTERIAEYDEDTSYTDNITCPHCGFEYTDSFEFHREGDGEINCDNCSNDFEFSCNFSVDYSTNKKDVSSEVDE